MIEYFYSFINIFFLDGILTGTISLVRVDPEELAK